MIQNLRNVRSIPQRLTFILIVFCAFSISLFFITTAKASLATNRNISVSSEPRKDLEALTRGQYRQLRNKLAYQPHLSTSNLRSGASVYYNDVTQVFKLTLPQLCSPTTHSVCQTGPIATRTMEVNLSGESANVALYALTSDINYLKTYYTVIGVRLFPVRTKNGKTLYKKMRNRIVFEIREHYDFDLGITLSMGMHILEATTTYFIPTELSKVNASIPEYSYRFETCNRGEVRNPSSGLPCQ